MDDLETVVENLEEVIDVEKGDQEHAVEDVVSAEQVVVDGDEKASGGEDPPGESIFLFTFAE
jgi:hypothetical protein